MFDDDQFRHERCHQCNRLKAAGWPCRECDDFNEPDNHDDLPYFAFGLGIASLILCVCAAWVAV